MAIMSMILRDFGFTAVIGMEMGSVMRMLGDGDAADAFTAMAYRQGGSKAGRKRLPDKQHHQREDQASYQPCAISR